MPFAAIAWRLAFLLGVVLAVYGPVFAYPLIQDDWKWMYELWRSPPKETLASILDPRGALFYRPLSGLFHFGAYHLFGAEAVAYRVAAVALLAISGLLADLMALAVTGRRLLGGCCGFLFVTASSVHMDPMLWGVGINDLACMTGMFLAMLLLLQAKFRMSAVVFLASLYFKESGIWFPALALFVLVLRQGFRMSVKPWLPFAAAWMVYGLTRLGGVQAHRLPADHPYAVSFHPSALAANAICYAEWLVGLLVPPLATWERFGLFLWQVRSAPAVAAAVVFAVVLLCAAILYHACRAARRGGAAICIPMFWLMLALSIFLLMPNHLYRYYLNLALIPFFLLFLIGVAWLLERLRLSQAVQNAALAALVAGIGIWNASFFRLRHHEGLGQRFLAGTNSLIARGTSVRIAKNFVESRRDRIPEGACLVFAGLDTWGFLKSAGPRVWLRDRTALACDVSDVGVDEGGLYVSAAPAALQAILMTNVPPRRVHPDQSRIRALVMKDGRLHEVAPEALSDYLREMKRAP
jgi:hypothetical protein